MPVKLVLNPLDMAHCRRYRAGLSAEFPRSSQALQAAGLVLGTVTKVVDKYCNHLGTVMSQNPAARTAVSPGSAVSVTIGQAPPNGCP